MVTEMIGQPGDILEYTLNKNLISILVSVSLFLDRFYFLMFVLSKMEISLLSIILFWNYEYVNWR